jgi:hypothetical protein
MDNFIKNYIEYMKIHLISLEQDRLNTDYRFSAKECHELNGQIKATEHLLSVANDILNNDIQGKGY